MYKGETLKLFKELISAPFSINNLVNSMFNLEFSILNASSGDTVIPKKISSYKIIDIAQYISCKYDIPINITGLRPGEKLFETLISYTESLRTIELDDYYIIKPTYKQKFIKDIVSFNEFNSNTNVKHNLDELILNSINNF